MPAPLVSSVAAAINDTIGTYSDEARDALLEEVEAVLGKRIRSMRLSPALADLYVRASWPRRGRVIRSWLKWVAAMCAVSVLVDAILCPAILPIALLVRVVLLPAVYAGLLAIWARPRRPFVEGLTFPIATFAIMAVAISLGAASGGALNERYLTAGLFAASTAVAIWPTPVVCTLAGGVTAVVAYLVALVLDPHLDGKTTLVMTIYYLAAIVSFVSARHGKELIMKHSFLLNLRGELQAAALVRANAKLQVLAALDGLTGLYNRRTIEQSLTEIVAAGKGVGVVLADIDHFKSFNDLAGHLAGDDCLRAIASALREAAGSTATAGRYGGEEFVLVVEGGDGESLERLCAHIAARVEALGVVHPAYADKRLVTLSMGSAWWPAGTDAPAVVDLLACADSALYAAKALGRDRACAADMASIIADRRLSEAA